MKVGLFLGAGASVCLGMPTTEKLKEKLKTTYPSDENNYNDANTRNGLLQELLKIRGFDDIEYILQALYNFIDFHHANKGIKLIKGMEQYADHNIVRINGRQLQITEFTKYISEIKDLIQDEIFKNYSWTNVNDYESILPKIFKPLINQLNEYTGSIDIFTTNYDCNIEEYCRNTNTTIIDGFDTVGDRFIWNDSNYDRNNNKNSKIHLYKLHGSLTWNLNNYDDKIEKINVEHPFNMDRRTNLLIYPTLDPKDDVCKEPYQTILGRFKKYMSDADVCICIGYSFRDSHVNKIFIEFIKNKRCFIIISPSSHTDFFTNMLDKNNIEYNNKQVITKYENGTIYYNHDSSKSDLSISLNNMELNHATIEQIIKHIDFHIEKYRSQYLS